MDIEELGLISSREASEMIGVNMQRLRILVKHYKIPHVMLGRVRIFLKSDVKTFMEERKEKLKHRKNS